MKKSRGTRIIILKRCLKYFDLPMAYEDAFAYERREVIQKRNDGKSGEDH